MNFEVPPEVLSLKSMYADHQSASPQCLIQHFSQFELRTGETLPETIVFTVSNYKTRIFIMFCFSQSSQKKSFNFNINIEEKLFAG